MYVVYMYLSNVVLSLFKLHVDCIYQILSVSVGSVSNRRRRTTAQPGMEIKPLCLNIAGGPDAM